MRTLLKSGIVVWSLVMLMCGEASADSLVAKVNRNIVPQGETFILTLDYEGKKDISSIPDFSVLDNDFRIYSTSSSFNSTSFNGEVSRSRQWQIALAPTKSGEITIPSINLEGIKSNPVTIKVANEPIASKATSGEGQQLAKFSIEAGVDNMTPYVQQQVNYTLTIYDRGGLQGDAPQIIDNGKNDWVVRMLKEPTVANKIVNGQNLREIKFYYALFPQKSGVLTTPDIRFNGFYVTRGGNRSQDPFEEALVKVFDISSMFGTRNPVLLTPKPINVDVKPAAVENGGKWWVPATKVELEADFVEKSPQFKVGEAFSRDIVLKAYGVLDNQLPDIHFAQSQGLKQYPEKPKTSTAVEGDEVAAYKSVHNVYIPSKPGKIELPEISVDWFNVNTGKTEKAVVPAVSINVEGSALATQEPVIEKATPLKVENTPQTPVQKAAPAVPNGDNYFITAIALVIGIAIGYILFRPRNKTAQNRKKAVIDAAKATDLKALRDSLLAWANEYYVNGKVFNLKDVAALSNSAEFSREMDNLMNALYSENAARFDFAKFSKIFAKISSRKNRRKDSKQPLPKLYE